MIANLASGGSKKLISSDNATKEFFYINPDLTTLTFGSTATFDWTIDKKGKYGVLDDIKIRFNSKLLNDFCVMDKYK